VKGTVENISEPSVLRLPHLDTIIRGVLYVYIFSLPFNTLRLVERNGFVILLVLVLLWCLIRRTHFLSHVRLGVPLLAFVVWVGVTIPFAAFPEYSGKEFGKLLQQIFLFYVVVYFFNSALHRRRLIWVLLSALGIVSVYGLYEFVGMIGVLPQLQKVIVLESLTSGEVWLTTYLVMGIPIGAGVALCAQELNLKWFAIVVAGIATLCLLLTFSRAGALAFFVELVILASLVKKPVLRGIVLVSILSLGTAGGVLFVTKIETLPTFSPDSSLQVRGLSAGSLMHRLDIWKFTIDRVLERPLVGHGYGKDNFRLVNGQGEAEQVEPGHYPIREAGTHNIYLDLAWGVGLPGLGLFLWVMGLLIIETLGRFCRAMEPFDKALLLGVGMMVVGLLVRLCFDQMLIGTLANIFWVLAALGIVTSRNLSLSKNSQACTQVHA